MLSTPGQCAYEAWIGHDRGAFNDWADCSADYRAYWERAAQAVLDNAAQWQQVALADVVVARVAVAIDPASGPDEAVAVVTRRTASGDVVERLAVLEDGKVNVGGEGASNA